ncbi:uncharacterized protein [Symphalangus syndactylus]|uniref:uncharacterized protein isoform X2 n=1 Tax=Symphalangus syndactylus TaxID=9590 RepID=UPI00300406C4
MGWFRPTQKACWAHSKAWLRPREGWPPADAASQSPPPACRELHALWLSSSTVIHLLEKAYEAVNHALHLLQVEGSGGGVLRVRNELAPTTSPFSHHPPPMTRPRIQCSSSIPTSTRPSDAHLLADLLCLDQRQFSYFLSSRGAAPYRRPSCLVSRPSLGAAEAHQEVLEDVALRQHWAAGRVAHPADRALPVLGDEVLLEAAHGPLLRHHHHHCPDCPGCHERAAEAMAVGHACNQACTGC